MKMTYRFQDRKHACTDAGAPGRRWESSWRRKGSRKLRDCLQPEQYDTEDWWNHDRDTQRLSFLCVPVLDSHPSNSTVVTAEGVSVHYAECSKDKLWFGRVGLKTCLANVRGCLKTVRTWAFARIIPSLRYFSNASVFVVILLKILMVVLTNGGAGWCRAARRMVFSWNWSEFCVLSSLLPSCLHSLSVWLAGCCLWLLVDVLVVGNQVCPGWPVGNEGGFRLVVPKKGSDKSLVLFCVFGAGDAFARNMRGLFWLGCAIRKCESVYSCSIINLKCHTSKNVL